MIQINLCYGCCIILAGEYDVVFSFLCQQCGYHSKRLMTKDHFLSLELFWIKTKPFKVCHL